VTLVARRIPLTYPPDVPEEITLRKDGLVYHSVTESLYFETDYVRRVCRDVQPQGIIFAHGSASFDASLLDCEVPVWIDLCGHVMAEAQAKAAVYKDDSYLEYFFQRVI
jgi:hypothetical protein